MNNQNAIVLLLALTAAAAISAIIVASTEDHDYGVYRSAASSSNYYSADQEDDDEHPTSLLQSQQLIFNGAPYFTTGVPVDHTKGFPYYDNWVTPWSTYGRPVPNWIHWEPDFNPPGHMDWDPTIVNPPAYKLENPNPYEDGLIAPPDNATPYYAAKNNNNQNTMKKRNNNNNNGNLKAAISKFTADERKVQKLLQQFNQDTQTWHSDVQQANLRERKMRQRK